MKAKASPISTSRLQREAAARENPLPDTRGLTGAAYQRAAGDLIRACDAMARQRPPMPEALRGKHVSTMTHDELRAFARSVGLTPTDVTALRRY